MQKIYISLLILAGMILLVSCQDNFLEPELDNTLATDQVWSDPDFAQGVLLNAYAALPSFYTSYGGGFLDVATDNAVTNNYNSPLYQMAMGGWSEWDNPISIWRQAYDQIRNVNLFLENGLDTKYSLVSESEDQKIKTRLEGEAYFLRAWFQWQLLKRYGGESEEGNILGFPIITKVYENELIDLPRNTYEESITQIMADLDKAIALLPNKYTGNDQYLGENQVGRASGQAALALKSRVSLYAASPAFTKSKSNDEKNTLWEQAAINAQKAIDNIGALPNINTNFYNSPNNSEVIMRKFSSGAGPEAQNFPPSLYGSGNTNPTQDLVDAFPMANGYPIDASHSNYDPDQPYHNRDPRFYMTILYNDADFKDTNIETFEGGKDVEISQTDATRTGYYLRKWMSSQVSLVPGDRKGDQHYYALFRKVEAYLNYAEAANEAWGPNQDPLGLGMTAKDAIIAVRERAGIKQPDDYVTTQASMGKMAFRNLIHNERRIELCFEGQRFFDLRRWETPIDELNSAVHGMKIKKMDDGTFDYSVFEVEERHYKDFMYYGPLPDDELQKSGNLVQNKGW